MWIGIGMVIGVYCVLVGGLFAFQRRLMYFPAKMTAPRLVLRGVQDIFVETSDKLRLQTGVHAARPGYPTVLYFHGNALHLGERAAWFNAFIDAGFGLVAVSHRGFGKSEGSPSTENVLNFEMLDRRDIVGSSGDYRVTVFLGCNSKLLIIKAKLVCSPSLDPGEYPTAGWPGSFHGQPANFERDPWPAAVMSRLPSPEQAKTRTMPTDDRAIPDDAKSRLVHFFNDNFEIIDEPKPQLGAGLTLAQQAARVYPMEPKYDQSA